MMDVAKSHKTAGAFRAALETRLQTRARKQGTDLQRQRRKRCFVLIANSTLRDTV
jgi:hypothetical protein